VTLARRIVSGLEECLRSHAGLELPAWVIESRAVARMSALGLSPAAYLELISSAPGAGELRALLEAVRVGETRFFRHRPQVDALLEVVVPAWRERDERSPRVWSAGCASGEEAYTLALVLSRAMPRPVYSPTILGTDVSAEAIAVAKRGVYPASAREHVPPPWQDGLLACVDAEQRPSVHVDPDARALVTFRQQNLADPELPRGFDLVWCRNVLIYFAPEARARAMERLVDALEPGGFLFVGYSETLRDVAGLRAIRLADQVLWEKPGPGAALTPIPRQRSKMNTKPSAALQAASLTPRIKLQDAERSRSTRSVKPSPPGVLAANPDLGVSVVRVTATNAAALSAELGAALRAPGLSALTVDLDAATYLEDDAATVLRRACALALAGGIELSLRATRPGPKRWLRRNGFEGGEA